MPEWLGPDSQGQSYLLWVHSVTSSPLAPPFIRCLRGAGSGACGEGGGLGSGPSSFSRDLGTHTDRHSQPRPQRWSHQTVTCPSLRAGWGRASERDPPGPRGDGGEAWPGRVVGSCHLSGCRNRLAGSGSSELGGLVRELSRDRQTDRQSRPFTLLDRESRPPRGQRLGRGSSGNASLLFLDLLSAVADSFPGIHAWARWHPGPGGCSLGPIYTTLMVEVGCRCGGRGGAQPPTSVRVTVGPATSSMCRPPD